MFVCCECCALSDRGLCDELITRPEKSYRLCCVVVCDLETSRMGAPYIYIYDISHLRVKICIASNKMECENKLRVDEDLIACIQRCYSGDIRKCNKIFNLE